MRCTTRMLGIGVLAMGAPAVAQAPWTPLWVRQFGTGPSYDVASSLASDSAGGCFVAGTTTGSLGGPSAGLDDAWLAGYDSAGNRSWIRQFGTFAVDAVRALASDGAGGAFIGGETWASLGGTYIGNSDNWLARYDSAGNELWIRQFGSLEWDLVWALAPDGAGGAFLAGDTGDALGGPHLGGSDAWLARYDSAGNQIWIRQFGTSAWEHAYALASDGAGGAFVAGSTQGSLGGPHAGDEDAWLARYDSAGNQLWIRQLGTSEFDPARALASDGAGGAFVAGITSGSLGGPGAGDADAWIARYDGAGSQIWIRQFGTSASDSAWALGSDGAGGAFVAGDTQGSLAGPGAGDMDAWLARFDSAGNQVLIHQFGTSVLDEARSLATDGAGGAFVAGQTRGSLGGPSAGGFDIWLARVAAQACYADCDGSGELDFFDFLCFQNLFGAADPRADCDGSAALDFFDFLCFQNEFGAGCL